MLFKKKNKYNESLIVNTIYKKDRLIRYAQFLLGIFFVAAAYNVFILPTSIVYGVGGLGVILKKLFGYDPSLVILISSVLLLILSFILLGKDKTRNTIVGSLLYPLFVTSIICI